MERASPEDNVDDQPPDESSDESDYLEVDPSGRYGKCNEVLGKGAYKTVYKAFDSLDGIEVAWNQVSIKEMIKNDGDMQRLSSELHLLKTLKHKNIMKFYSSWVDSQNANVNFITEIFTSGSLRQYRRKHKHVDMRAIKNWARQILRALMYLHSHDPPIIHRDLKCDNIFINGNQGEVKIGDFGLAAILRETHAAHSVIGTPEFMAPELYEEEYNELVDIYSFGMCVLEMLTFEYPYSECTNAAQIYKKVTAGKRPASLSKVKDPRVREFIEKCLASAPHRLHARELIVDPFLKSEEDMEAVSLQSMALSMNSSTGLDPISEESSSCFTAFDCQYKDHDEKLKKSLAVHAEIDSSASQMMDGGLRNKELIIQSKKQNEKRILIWFRIACLEGGYRHIRFEFDTEADTAMSVASEMITELDLADQDVTMVADMIDSEILALIPGWKPGASFEEDQCEPCALSSHVLESSCLESNPNSMSLEVGQFPRNTGCLHGRFEEVECCYEKLAQSEEHSTENGFFRNSSARFDRAASSLLLDGVHNQLNSGSISSTCLACMGNSAEGLCSFSCEDKFKASHGGSRSQMNGSMAVDEKCLGSEHDSLLTERLRLLNLRYEEEVYKLRLQHKQALHELMVNLGQSARVKTEHIADEIMLSSSNAKVTTRFQSEHCPDGTISSSSNAKVTAMFQSEHIANEIISSSSNTKANYEYVHVESEDRAIMGGLSLPCGTSLKNSSVVVPDPARKCSVIKDMNRNEKERINTANSAGYEGDPCYPHQTGGRSPPPISARSNAKGSSELAFVDCKERENIGGPSLSLAYSGIGLKGSLLAPVMALDPAKESPDNKDVNAKVDETTAAYCSAYEGESYSDSHQSGGTSLSSTSLIALTDAKNSLCNVDLNGKDNDTDTPYYLPYEATCSNATMEQRVCGSQIRGTKTTHNSLKGERPLTRRNSYLELYKEGPQQKERISSSKTPDITGAGSLLGKPPVSDLDELEQLRKERVQKSIAELEAKTLEGLLQCKTKYLVTSSTRTQAPSSLLSSTATLTRRVT